jgi:hypothetical protein
LDEDIDSNFEYEEDYEEEYLEGNYSQSILFLESSFRDSFPQIRKIQFPQDKKNFHLPISY